MEDIINAFLLMSNFVFVPAIAYGSQLALGAVGVTLVYGILRFSNFAHGDTMAFGTMVVILFTWFFQAYGINLGPLPTAILALPFGILFTIIFLLACDKLVYKFYRERKAVPVTYLIASVGI
ncbi:branched-chain amino acid ABC transporter permease, partial [Amylibacter sp.]|nr:branched-chain amino acid ABC transporter permease [Amylibacter sp.]